MRCGSLGEFPLIRHGGRRPRDGCIGRKLSSIKAHPVMSVAETVQIPQVQFLFEVDDVPVVFATTGKDGPNSAETC